MHLHACVANIYIIFLIGTIKDELAVTLHNIYTQAGTQFNTGRLRHNFV